MNSVIIVIQLLFKIYSTIVLVDILLSFFLSPYHQLRYFLDKLVNPLLNPIRKVLPSVGPFDFSPVVLLLALQLAEYLIVQILR